MRPAYRERECACDRPLERLVRQRLSNEHGAVFFEMHRSRFSHELKHHLFGNFAIRLATKHFISSPRLRRHLRGSPMPRCRPLHGAPSLILCRYLSGENNRFLLDGFVDTPAPSLKLTQREQARCLVAFAPRRVSGANINDDSVRNATHDGYALSFRCLTRNMRHDNPSPIPAAGL
jgi:hypothetical protein